MGITKLQLKTIYFEATLKRNLVRFGDDTHRPVGIIYPIHANFCNKSNSGGCLWVSRSTFHFQTVYPVLIIGLKNKEKHKNTFKFVICISCIFCPNAEFPLLTLAGPMIMPVHRVRVMSSSSSRPQLTVPSPSPFCPSSSSSNKRKLRGTLTSERAKTHYDLQRFFKNLSGDFLYFSYC